MQANRNEVTVTRDVWGRRSPLGLSREPQADRPDLTQRRNQNTMNDAEKTAYRGALERLIDTGFFGALVNIHSDMTHRMHGTFTQLFAGYERFLPWHRVYLSRLGEALRGIDENLFVPYWQWTIDRDIPDWLRDFMPQDIPMPGGGQLDVVRSPGIGVPELPSLASIQDIRADGTWHDFTRRLEGEPFGAHNQVHVWVGGTMGRMVSPADPLFWMHHAEIDRIWASWEIDHPDEGPRVTGADAVLDPWPETVVNVADTTGLRYTYDTLELG